MVASVPFFRAQGRKARVCPPLAARRRGRLFFIPLLCLLIFLAAQAERALAFSARPETAPPQRQEEQNRPEAGVEYDRVLPDEQAGFSEEAGSLPLSAPEEEPAPAGGAVALRDVVLRVFSQEPPRERKTIVPKFREQAFPLNKAVNLDAIEALTGPLSEERRRFLQEHRFLLIPFDECEAARSKSMLEFYSLIGEGKRYGDSPAANAIFAGPDPYLHALHAYLAERYAHIEQTELSVALLHMLEGLYDNAVRMGEAAGPAGAESFRRLQAQFLLPLAILKSALPGGAGGASAYEQKLLEEQAKEFGTSLPASEERVLELIGTYDIAEEDAAALKHETQAIFRADSAAPSALLSRHYGEARPIDYRLFTPAGGRERLPLLRSWHRALTWLESMSWDLGQNASAMDAVNFALLMSMPSGGKNEESLAPPCDHWRKIAEISSFFFGFAAEGGYPEWAHFLRENMGLASLGPDAASEEALLDRIREGLPALKPFSPFFASVQRPALQREIRAFPRRFSLPRFLQQELSKHPDPERSPLPALYSSLWAAAVMDCPLAVELLPAQVRESLEPKPAPTPFHHEGEGLADWTEPVSEATRNDAAAAMRVGVRRLNLLLREEPLENWSSSLSSGWLHLLGTLATSPGKGAPLYMQSPMFRAKQLETFLSSLAERESGKLPRDEGPRAEEADNTWEANPAADKDVPDGFVEPNPAFWQGMAALVKTAEALFESYGLFPEDREAGGLLDSFINQLGLCATIAEKELLGKKVSRLEYEALREGFDLSRLLQPVEEETGETGEDREALRLIQTTGTRLLYGATGRPSVMLVLAGDGNNPRIAVGAAYSHWEFTTTPQARLTEGQWRQWRAAASSGQDRVLPLPPKPFWYDGLEGGQRTD